MSKEIIISSARNALLQSRLNGAQKPYKDFIKHSSSDIIQEYIAIQNANKAIVVEAKDPVAAVAEILQKIGAANIRYTQDLALDFSKIRGAKPFDKSVDFAREELFSVDTSIIKAYCGVADVGIFGVVSSPKHPRLASLLTKNCIAILERKNIVQSISDGVELMKKTREGGNGANEANAKEANNEARLPSNMIFIAGASRTADIELKTVFGVHGPQIVYVVLV